MPLQNKIAEQSKKKKKKKRIKTVAEQLIEKYARQGRTPIEIEYIKSIIEGSLKKVGM